MDYFKGQPCGQENCREIRFYVADDGYTYCRRGHRTEAKVITAEEDDNEYGRFSKKTRKVLEDTEQAPKDEPHQSASLYLQCFQVVLRKQAHWLIHKGGYPSQLEQTLKDIWTFRVQIIQDMLKDPKEGFTQQSFSSQNIVEHGNRIDRERQVKYRKFIDVPRIPESLALCYLALIMLKVPISLSDIRRWCLSNDFIYVQAGSGKVIPLSLFRRVPGYLRLRLQVQKGLPEPGELADLITSYTAFFNQSFGLHFPPLREVPILYRLLSNLTLPIEVYQGVRAISTVLNLDFDFPQTIPELRYIVDHPELRLVSLLVVIVKLYYPFDEVLRTPRKSFEPTSFTMNWELWNRELRKPPKDDESHEKERESEQKVNERALNRTAEDVFSMDEQEIDEYLDWFQRQFITDEVDERSTTAEFNRALYGMFPLDTTPKDLDESEASVRKDREATVQRMRNVLQNSIKQPSSKSSRKRTDSDLPVRPGAQYRIYREISQLPSNSKLFFEMCAKSVDISLEQMVSAVYRIEMRIQKSLANVRFSGKKNSDEDIQMRESGDEVDERSESTNDTSDSDEDMS